MLTREQILTAIRAGRASECGDNRDYNRLSRFFAVEDLSAFYVEVTPELAATWNQLELTREAVLENLRGDLAFAFEKALDRRRISSAMMYSTVLMWMWVLEDELQHRDDQYEHFGLPLFKAVALKYELPNPIGNDRGSELKYSLKGPDHEVDERQHQTLLEEAALILEQEGWLVERAGYDTGSSRMRRFGERYRAWQTKVDEFRKSTPQAEAWPKPPDNS